MPSPTSRRIMAAKRGQGGREMALHLPLALVASKSLDASSLPLVLSLVELACWLWALLTTGAGVIPSIPVLLGSVPSAFAFLLSFSPPSLSALLLESHLRVNTCSFSVVVVGEEVGRRRSSVELFEDEAYFLFFFGWKPYSSEFYSYPLSLSSQKKMSSLSRRACYKCGELGHHAEACSSPHRLCYNCKQPNHESSDCPLPRTTEAKQCYHCQGLGHVQADCPTLRLSGANPSNRNCYTCGLPGHFARDCTNPATGNLGRGAPVARGGFGGGRGGFAPRGGFSGGPRPATCYKCGGPNHFARDCQAQAMKCYACGKLGHISRDCTAPNGGPLNTAGKSCYACGQTGHISRDCPNRNNTNGEAKEEGDLTAGQSAAAPVVSPVPPVA